VKYTNHPLDASGWTPWIQPLPSYRIACCDCGLVHELRFRVVRGQVQYQARRHVRATAARRRKRR
jgi:hypothetical protein